MFGVGVMIGVVEEISREAHGVGAFYCTDGIYIAVRKFEGQWSSRESWGRSAMFVLWDSSMGKRWVICAHGARFWMDGDQ